MVTPTNRVIAGQDLHRARPLTRLTVDFRNIFLPKIGEDQKKVLRFQRGALSWYCAILW